MKILFADSGSTKTHWALVEEVPGLPKMIRTAQTQGLNPLYVTPEQITLACRQVLADVGEGATGDYNYTFARYEKMGIIGANGTGKSTYLKLLLGKLQPDEGSFEVGETVRFGYYSQDGIAYDEQKKVIDVVRDIAEYVLMSDGSKMSASEFLKQFLFTPDKQYSYVYNSSRRWYETFG